MRRIWYIFIILLCSLNASWSLAAQETLFESVQELDGQPGTSKGADWRLTDFANFALQNDNNDELYGHKVVSGSVTGDTLTLVLADASTILVDVATLLDNTDAQTVTAFNLNSSTNILTLTLSGGNTSTVDLSGLVGTDGLIDAPSDGTTYGRLNGEWVTVTGGGITDGNAAGDLTEWDGDSWEPVTPDEVSFVEPLSYDDTLKEVSIDTTGLGGISHVASGNPDDGSCNWNTADFILRCRTGATVYASAAMTLEATLDITAPIASVFATDSTGLQYSFTASETSTVDCTKLTATWTDAGTVTDFTGTDSPCVSSTPVYSDDTGTMAGAQGFLIDTATNESIAFSGEVIDNSLNTETSELTVAEYTATPTNSIAMLETTGGRGQGFIATQTAVFKQLRVYVSSFEPGAVLQCQYDSTSDMTTPLATDVSEVITEVGWVNLDFLYANRTLVSGTPYYFGCVYQNAPVSLATVNPDGGYVGENYRYAGSGTGWNLGTSITASDMLFQIIGE
jgi:hypothetical protein